MVVFGVFGAEGRWLEFHSSRHAGTFCKSFTRSCLYDVMWRPAWHLAVKFNSCNNLLSFVHTLLVNILRHDRLYIKRKYYYYIIIITYSPIRRTYKSINIREMP